MNIICEAYINYKLKGIVTLDELYSFYNNNNFIFKNKKNLIFKKILIMNGYTKFITDDYIGIYKELLDIVKYSTISNSLTLYLANDKLIVIEYKLASLGTIKIGLAYSRI